MTRSTFPPPAYCDPCDPRIVAMAHKLGAFQVSDLEFAKRAHDLAKNQMIVEYVPFDYAGDTLERGTGTCFHLANTMVALCRAAGIKARYKVFAMNMIAVWYDNMLGADSFMQKWYDSLGYFLIEAEVQVLIDGKWMDGVVGPDDGWQAYDGRPHQQAGRDLPGGLVRGHTRHGHASASPFPTVMPFLGRSDDHSWPRVPWRGSAPTCTRCPRKARR